MKYTLCKVRQELQEYSVWIPSKNARIGEEVRVQTKDGWWKILRLLSESTDEKALEKAVMVKTPKEKKTKKK